MRFDCLDDLWIERSEVGRSAKRTIAHVTPRPARNLSYLDGVEAAQSAAVEFVDPGKGDMVEIHVEPHPDRICGDQIIDLARLKHADLCITSPWAQRPENKCSPTSLTADQFGERKYVCHR